MIKFFNKVVGIFNTSITSKKKVPVDGFRHEALHVTNLFIENIEDHLVNHHYYHSGVNPEFNKQIDLAIETMMNAYLSLNEFNELSKKIDNPFFINPHITMIPEYSKEQLNIQDNQINEDEIFYKFDTKKVPAGRA
jgi:hypothetical protein